MTWDREMRHDRTFLSKKFVLKFFKNRPSNEMSFYQIYQTCLKSTKKKKLQ